MMNRESLAQKLTVLKAALANNNMVPALTHYWFTGKVVRAYNDRLMIHTKFETDFVGAVPGDTLLKLLNSPGPAEVEFEKSANDLLITMGKRTKVKLATMDLPDMFTMPELADEDFYIKDDKLILDLIDAIDDCSRSISDDTSVPDQLGVTLIPDKERILVFSTNSKTVSHTIVDCPGLKHRVILGHLFCEQLVGMKGAEKLRLEIRVDDAIFRGIVDSTKYTIFGRNIQSDKPISFQSVINEHFPKEDHKKLVEVPPGLVDILMRATVMLDETSHTKSVLKIEDERLTLHTKSSRGEITDTIKIKGHPNVTFDINPKLSKIGVENFTRMLITEGDRGCLTLTNDDMTSLYLIASWSA
jgi:DNA polymerase III sliding clamp (beta) subunit (PCNA family)